MSAPEIFCPPRNSVPFLGCSNMDAILEVERRGYLEKQLQVGGEVEVGVG